MGARLSAPLPAALIANQALQMLQHLPDNVLKAVDAIQAKDIEPVRTLPSLCFRPDQDHKS